MGQISIHWNFAYEFLNLIGLVQREKKTTVELFFKYFFNIFFYGCGTFEENIYPVLSYCFIAYFCKSQSFMIFPFKWFLAQ